MKVAISTSSFGESSPEALKLLRLKGIEVKNNPFGRRLTENEIIEHLQDVDGLLAGLEPLNQNVMSQSKQLKAIARVGTGVANVDFKAAAKHNIKVSNTPDGPTFAVAEMTIAALLSVLRDIPNTNAKMHAGEWPKQVNKSLNGKTLLIIGFGRIGQKFAELASIFQANILVYEPENVEVPAHYEKVSLDKGLRIADIISLHASGEEEIIGEQELAMMKGGVVLLNSARGNLINEAALVSNLKSGKVHSAWIDSFWEEPYKGELLNFDNVLLTPHTSTYTEKCRASMEMDAVKNLLIDLGVE